MYGRITTLAFVGIEARITNGQHNFAIVGLPDKAVAESRERVRNALHAVGLGLPWTRITVNLAPADLLKEGSHFDLPITLALMAAMGAISPDAIQGFAAIGELGLDAAIHDVPGALPAAIGAHAVGKGLICPKGNGPEAAWAGEEVPVVAPEHLLSLINHFRGDQVLRRPDPDVAASKLDGTDLADIKGQELAKRALEVAAAPAMPASAAHAARRTISPAFPGLSWTALTSRSRFRPSPRPICVCPLRPKAAPRFLPA